jgi:hypothetical protein
MLRWLESSVVTPAKSTTLTDAVVAVAADLVADNRGVLRSGGQTADEPVKQDVLSDQDIGADETYVSLCAHKPRSGSVCWQPSQASSEGC